MSDEILIQHVFLEASALYSLPPHVINADFERLIKLAKDFSTAISIPQISFQEWMQKRTETLQGSLEQVSGINSMLSRTFSRPFDATVWAAEKDGFIKNYENRTREILKANDIDIVDTPYSCADLQLNNLLDMAVKKIAPFEEKGEKGFRDAVNLFTFLENVKSKVNLNENNIFVLVTNDDIYSSRQISDLVTKRDINMRIYKNIKEASDALEAGLKELKKFVEDYKQQTLQSFIKTKIDFIADFIRKNGIFSIGLLNKGMSLGLFPEIEAIGDIQVIDILDPIRGALVKGETISSAKVSFKAKTKISLKIRSYPSTEEPKFRFGESAQSVITTSGTTTIIGLTTRTIDRIVEVDIPVEASVTVVKSGVLKDEYSNLEIERILL